jgi:hypothetical protein
MDGDTTVCLSSELRLLSEKGMAAWRATNDQDRCRLQCRLLQVLIEEM